MKNIKIALALIVMLIVGQTAYAYTINGNLTVLGTTFDFGSSGVRISNDGDGAITFLSLGNGSHEELTLNLDDTANTGVFTSSTGLNVLNFSGITLQESGNAVLTAQDIDTSGEIAAIVTGEEGTGALVFANSPHLTTPIIPNFSNATHTHANASQGGQLDWDNVWSDAVHSHQNNAEGGTLDAAAITSSVTGSGNVVKSASPTFTGTPTIQAGGELIMNSITGEKIVGNTSLNFYVDNGSGVNLGMILQSVYLILNKSIIPGTTATYDLGSSPNKWKDIWATNPVIQTSDLREKKEIEDSDLSLEFLNKLRPVSYRWKKGDNGKHYGFIAQEVIKTLDGKEFAVIRGNEKDHYGIAYNELIAPMVKAIQELNSRIKYLERHQEKRRR